MQRTRCFFASTHSNRKYDCRHLEGLTTATLKVKARWISASLKPMSIDHTPESDFEKKAANEIADSSQQLSPSGSDSTDRWLP